jgi:hypothetical protein
LAKKSDIKKTKLSGNKGFLRSRHDSFLRAAPHETTRHARQAQMRLSVQAPPHVGWQLRRSAIYNHHFLDNGFLPSHDDTDSSLPRPLPRPRPRRLGRAIVPFSFCRCAKRCACVSRPCARSLGPGWLMGDPQHNADRLFKRRDPTPYGRRRVRRGAKWKRSD